MPTKKVDKTGVYRSGKTGHSVFLRKDEQANEALLAEYAFDSEASKSYNAEPERSYFSSVVDAPQDRKERAEKPPENRKEPPVENRSDAELAAAAAKGSKV